MKGRLILIVGPSAAGKTELVKALLERVPNSARLVTVTTRPSRLGEINGNDYFFINRKEFIARIEKGDFLEYAEVYGNLYGQSKEVIDSDLKKHKYLFAIIDVKGARTIKSLMPEIFSIFVNPGSVEDIKARLCIIRSGITEAELNKRLATVSEELALMNTFDTVVDNLPGHFSKAVDTVIKLITNI